MKQISEKRYSPEELKEFEAIILAKLKQTKRELASLKTVLVRSNKINTHTSFKALEDTSETAETENLSQLAERLQKFVRDLESALVRINNGTYGICIATHQLIPKERLRLVPHTRHCISAKLHSDSEH